MTKLVQDAMTPGVQTVRPSNSAAEAARFMRDNDVGALPVLGDDSKPIGMVTVDELSERTSAARR